MVRSLLFGKRVLLLLDHVTEAAQVRPLVPGHPGSVILVTTRRDLPTLDSAYNLNLCLPDKSEALEILSAYAGPARIAADPHLARDLVELCNRSPLKLRLVGARIAREPDLPMSDLTAELANNTGRSRVAPHRGHVVRDQSRGIAGSNADYGLAPVIPLPLRRLEHKEVTVPHIADALDVTTTRVVAALDKLVDAGLAECDDGWYRLSVPCFKKPPASVGT